VAFAIVGLGEWAVAILMARYWYEVITTIYTPAMNRWHQQAHHRYSARLMVKNQDLMAPQTSQNGVNDMP